eukprot:TRINITY_DN50966_c0_g1_i1.p1 TRINITY_DN50966_c0_g1~~TRINITY_DN50966_c0_g1_i1.p1  ORF type:complete len:186 (+),score=29.54 TRINITY_DN50966_c0_g1_i1:151-708(+)
MFERLKNFQQVNGHANVPRRYADDPELGRWVYKRRKSRRGVSKYKITQDQIDKLDTVGFQWEFGSMHNWKKVGPLGLKGCAPEVNKSDEIQRVQLMALSKSPDDDALPLISSSAVAHEEPPVQELAPFQQEVFAVVDVAAPTAPTVLLTLPDRLPDPKPSHAEESLSPTGTVIARHRLVPRTLPN